MTPTYRTAAIATLRNRLDISEAEATTIIDSIDKAGHAAESLQWERARPAIDSAVQGGHYEAIFDAMDQFGLRNGTEVRG